MSADRTELFPAPTMTVDEGREVAAEIVDRAAAEHKPSRKFLLVSGGNDSAVLLDQFAPLADEIVHINTGIGIPETTAHVRRVAAGYDLPYSEWTPPISYEELVLGVWDGMPGPGAHRFTYTMLKERCVEALLRHHRRFRGERFMLLAGVRRAESGRRMGSADPVRRKGGQVWVNPLIDWSHANMAEYRQGESLPENEVSANLHMSGECLCGAFADQGDNRSEREAVRFFYPGFERRLTALENQCVRAGKTYVEWGVKRGRETGPTGPMCQGCEFRSLFDPAAPVEREDERP